MYIYIAISNYVATYSMYTHCVCHFCYYPVQAAYFQPLSPLPIAIKNKVQSCYYNDYSVNTHGYGDQLRMYRGLAIIL